MGKVLLLVSAAGALGGLLNALLSGAGFVLPQLAVVAGSRVLTPGFLGSVLAGAVAALISFGLYGPFSGVAVLRSGRSDEAAPPAAAQLTLAALAGAALVGYSGGRWITAEADRQLNHGTAVATAELAEHLAATGGSSGAARAIPPVTVPLGPSDVRSLVHTLQSRSPLEAYGEATRLSKAAR
jgi:hypothetical protein